MFKTSLLVVSLLVCGAAWADDTTAPKQSVDTKKPLARHEINPRNCLRSTGTRIVLRQKQCLTSPGRVYTQDDIQRTGAITPGGALRLLDPSAF
jgi:hypothetical protein